MIKFTLNNIMLAYEGVFIIVASIIICIYRHKIKKYEDAMIRFILEQQVDNYGYQRHTLRYHMDVFKTLIGWRD